MKQTSYPLTVYKASAGSGKTFTLTVEYITLLVKEPENYRKILAVTFTNKATQEMKMRILSQLYGIAKGLSSSDGYFQKVKEKTGLTDVVIRNNAQVALSLLIHKYHEFRVQTIDAFFQHILRNLAHELGQTANLRVDLNDAQVESDAVDKMIEELDESQPVFKWISEYIDENIEDDKGWNVIGKIKSFGNNIFQDFYKAHETELNELFTDEKFYNAYVAKLRKVKKDLAQTYKSKASNILKTIQDNNLDNAALFRQHVYSYFNKQVKVGLNYEKTPKYIQTCLEDATKWTSGKCPKELKPSIQQLAETQLQQQLAELEAFRIENWKPYQSAVLTLAHLSQLRLLHAISSAVDDLNKEYNRFMLSNTQSLLKGLIADSDTPFIFEKIGAQLKHIMIDEFQDTSTIQWSNFKTLLDNCIAQADSHNLIVGDIKQSIYRWRQGDWQLLNNIDKKFDDETIHIETLAHNYRSHKRVIDFNNAFFNSIINVTHEELVADKIEYAPALLQAYADVEQIPKKEAETGCVKIDLIPSKEADYTDQILELLCHNIEELLNAGYKQNDIAILIRTKSVLPSIAEAVNKHFEGAVNIVSDEAFRLDASLAVNILVDALHLLTHPHDVLTRGRLAKFFVERVRNLPNYKDSTTLVQLNNFTEDERKTMTKEELRAKGKDLHLAKLNAALPKEYVEQREKLLGMPILDLVDRLFHLFELYSLEGQSTYVCTFYDILNDYLAEHPADIDDFIAEWESSLSSKTIQSDEVDGVRLLTIHKSKGLEFENVLVPFCDWTLELSNTIWCETKDKETPYNELPLVPIDFYKNNMKGTVYEPDYANEHFQNTIDNMNLLYVAFTRAVRNLFVSGKRMSKKKRADLTGDVKTTSNRSQNIELSLDEIAEKLSSCIYEGTDNEKERLHFEYGNLESVLTKEPSSESIKEINESQNPFLSAIKTEKIRIETFPQTVEFRQSNKSNDFVSGEEVEETDRNRYIKVGNILHNLFSTIYTSDDIPARLGDLEQQGIIYNDDVTNTELREKIAQAMKNEKVKDWFSNRWKLFNECAIIQYDATTDEVLEHRPDRVMTDGNEVIVVDFKFGKEREEYKLQVQRYMTLLKEMGHQSIKGYLWYVMRDNIVEVTL